MKTDLELIVEEATPGHFYWTIVHPGHSGERDTVVDYAHGAAPSRGLATAAGLAALKRSNVRDDCLPARFDSQGKHADTGPAPLGHQ
jgi:hypothetical protein